ncbi:hypothetical protein OBBRIDRAFT_85920 [Obba rivulosa]|uniref:Secreted protein n=1 Tax=Obba rivulosa TaxID=1052685 RepID=A0A8E2AXM3_9APHY|nr:hypothetical protein OBBRIDRAFT_85920 [Obba rivulosa]
MARRRLRPKAIAISLTFSTLSCCTSSSAAPTHSLDFRTAPRATVEYGDVEDMFNQVVHRCRPGLPRHGRREVEHQF